MGPIWLGALPTTWAQPGSGPPSEATSTGRRPLLERAVELVGDDPRRPEFLERLGEVLDAQAEPRLARERLEEAIRGYQAQDDAVGAARAEVGLLAVRSSLESLEMEGVVVRGEELTALIEAAGDLRGWARATELVGSHLFFLGRITEAERRLTESLDRAPIASKERGFLAHWVTACVYWGPTPVDEGMRRIQQIIEENAGRRSVEAGACAASAA